MQTITLARPCQEMTQGANVSNFFGEWLFAMRERRGLSIRSLAAKSGLSTTIISYIESGERQTKKETVYKIADALDVETEEAISLWLRDKAGTESKEVRTEYIVDLSDLEVEGSGDFSDIEKIAHDKARKAATSAAKNAYGVMYESLTDLLRASRTNDGGFGNRPDTDHPFDVVPDDDEAELNEAARQDVLREIREQQDRGKQ